MNIPNILNVNTQVNSCSQKTDEKSGKRFMVQWRKVTNKKNKTWDGDGIIDVKGSSITAKIDGRTITKIIPRTDGIFKVGGYELEVDCEIGGSDKQERPLQLEQAKTTPHLAQIPSFKKLMPSLTKVKKPLFQKTEDSFVMKKGKETDTDVIIDPILSKVLRPHQKEGVSFMYNGVMGYSFGANGVLLADDMGLGKTLMSITLIWTLIKQSPNPEKKNEANKVLIMCPVTLINNWRREFKKWLNINQIGILVVDNNSTNYKQDLRNFSKSSAYQVMIMSYERLLNCEEEMLDIKFDLLVCDEGHKLKNNTNKSLKILTNMDVSKKVLLSGTPIQNNLTEFYTLINFINPGAFGTFTSFQKKFIKPIEMSREVNCYNKEVIKMGKTASKELSSITKTFVLRRTNDILFKYLSSKTDVLLFVKPSHQQLELFDLIMSNCSFADYDNNNVLNLINVFKKICNSPSLLQDDNLFNSLSGGYKTELSTSSGKIDLLIMMLIEIINEKKEKLVIVSNYTKTLDLLEKVLKKLNFEFLRLDGSTNPSTRTSIINQFNNVSFPRYPIFLLSSKSGGFGINLIGASRLILFDNDWNPSNDLQAMSRIYRDGQLKPVFIYRFFTTGCLDEKIFQRQLMKNNLSDKFLNDSKANSNVFDMNDLKDLFTVHEYTNCNTHDLLECDCGGQGDTQQLEPEVSDILTSEADNEDAQQSAVRSSSLSDGGWVSALNYSQMDQAGSRKKQSFKNALSDYKHHDPKINAFNCPDDIVQTIIKKTKSNTAISYVFTKVSNPVGKGPLLEDSSKENSVESATPEVDHFSPDPLNKSSPIFYESDYEPSQ
ncbi:helicase [Yamadazyma tenuis]|uniref:helicase n=1 Tax=Candida tenuis TaxID=2315449 RepID=UPI00279B3D1C|nr:helicase [Yamadazyma tenuis]